MLSVVFDGRPFEVHVRSLPKARVIRQTDAVIRVTSAAICGSDLHNYHGVFGSNYVPYPLGHEAMGIVEHVGTDVEFVRVGNRVIIPDMPGNGDLEVEPVITPTLALYGEGEEYGDLGGCQGIVEPYGTVIYHLLENDDRFIIDN